MKEGKIHKTTCHHARKPMRIKDSAEYWFENRVSWFGPYSSYSEAKKKANKISFRIWECSQYKPQQGREST